jgi:hypothetical protein
VAIRTAPTKYLSALRGAAFAFTKWSILLAVPRTEMTRAGRNSFASTGITTIETRALTVPSADGDPVLSSWKVTWSAVGTGPATLYAARVHLQAARTVWAVAFELQANQLR